MKISINLLPPEVIARESKNAKFYRIQFAGIAIILFMVFLAALTLALQVLQNNNIAIYKTKLTQAEERVSGLKSTQGSLLLLKDRITVINQYLGTSSKQSAMYKLVDELIPQSVIISAITIDKSGEVAFLASTSDPDSLDSLIGSLTSEDSNEGKIEEVLIESLNRGKDGTYRISFRIKPG